MTIQDAIFQTLTIPTHMGARLFPLRKHRKETPKVKLPRTQRISSHNSNLIIIRSPKNKDYTYLKRRYNFHPVHLDDILSSVQRPKIDIEEAYVFFVLHFPEFNEKTNRIESNELDLFVTKHDLVIIINDPYPPIEDIIQGILKKKSKRAELFAHGTGLLLYNILDKLVDSIFPLVEQIERSIDTIDRQVFLEEGKNAAETISFLQRNIIFFQTMIKPQLTEFRQIEETDHSLLTKELKTYFGNITDHLTKLWDRLEDAKELTDNLSTAVETYLTYKTNETIKILTGFSIITLPFIIIPGIYGMNLTLLPIAEHPMAFVIIASVMISMAYGMLLYFKSKRWI